MSVSSELPLGSGLGSSAAFCVSLCGAFLGLSDSVKVDFGQHGWAAFGEKEQQLVNKWAFEGEKIIHGKPSGIDNTKMACCFYSHDKIPCYFHFITRIACYFNF